eukprot:2459630-Alexandrium_andersonii.AAC.1
MCIRDRPSPRLGIGKSRRPPTLTARRRRRLAKRSASCVWTCGRGSPTFAESEPRRGPFGPLGVVRPRSPRAGFWAPSSL